MTAPLRTGEPLAGPVELAVAATTGTTTRAPTDSDAALEIPRAHVRGELRLRLASRGELAVVHERAVGPAKKLDPTQADVEGGQPRATGVATRYSIDAGGAWSVGLDLELVRWVVPYTEHRQCVEECDGVPLSQEIHDDASTLVWGFGVTPAYRVGRFTVYAGAAFKNHPTIVRKGTEIGSVSHDELEGGPLNVLVHAGVAVRASAFTAILGVAQDTSTDPVRYGPTVGLALSATLDPRP